MNPEGSEPISIKDLRTEQEKTAALKGSDEEVGKIQEAVTDILNQPTAEEKNVIQEGLNEAEAGIKLDKHKAEVAGKDAEEMEKAKQLANAERAKSEAETAKIRKEEANIDQEERELEVGEALQKAFDAADKK